MKKVVLLTILVFGLALTGCIQLPWLKTGPGGETNTNQEIKDKISILLENLKQETGIDFSTIEEIEFKWYFQGEEGLEVTMIAGKGFSVEKSPADKTPGIKTFLEGQHFIIDLYNVSAATIAGGTGYLKNKTVCLVVSGLTGYKEATGQWIPEETDKHDIDVSCGELEESKQEENCVKKDSQESLSLTEAKEIAIASECGDRLKDTYMCNENTGTWWLDLDIEKEGCSPACVVNVVTKEAEINWRCTGALVE